MANNIVEFIIKIRENAKKQTDAVNKAFQKANDNAKKLAATSRKLPLNIADLRGELAALERKKTFAKTENEIIHLNGTIAKTQKQLHRLENLPPNGFISRIKQAATAITGLSIRDIGIGMAAMKLKNFTKESVNLYDIQKKAEAQLQASLESTGYAAGRTFAELTKQASALQKKTIFGDEAIIKAQSVMLTFKQIRGSIFDQAMPAVLDLATKMGGDLQGAVVQVGKALQDPILGVTALRRVGIQFTEEQEASLKKLVESGKNEEAQLIILNELQSQFGGSAEAAAKAGLGPMQQLSNAWGDFKEKIGGTVLKVVNAVIPSFVKMVEWMDRNGHALKNIAKGVLVATAAFVSFKLAQLAVIKTSTLFRTAISLKMMAIKAYTFIVKGGTMAMKSFNAATKANAIGLVVAGLTAAVTAFIAFRKRGKEATAMLKEASNAGSDYYLKEKTFLEKQFTLMEKTNALSKDRNKLVDELKSRYPGLNSELEKELRESNDLNQAKMTMIELIKQQAITEGYKKVLTQKSEELAAAELAADAEMKENEEIDREYESRQSAINKFASPEAMAAGTFANVIGRSIEKSYKDQEKRDKITMELKAIEDALKLRKVNFLPTTYSGDGKVNFLPTTYSGDGTVNPETALDTITGGGKQVKNFYINIENLLRENTNIFQSSDDNPETADGFLEKLSRGLQMVVNDVNYAAS